MEKIQNFSWSSFYFIKIQNGRQISRFLQVGAKSCDKIFIGWGSQMEWQVQVYDIYSVQTLLKLNPILATALYVTYKLKIDR